MNGLRSLWRSTAYLSWTLLLLPVQLAALATRARLATTLPLFYHRGVRRIIGLDVACRGAPSPARPTLFVCNHVSYLDVVVLGSLIPGSFVAKHEVAGWPLFGLLARLQRSLFVARRGAAVVREHGEIGARLAAGDNMILFPEGTSSDGTRVLPFKSALLAAAERAAGPLAVQPVSIAYPRLDGQPLPRRLLPAVAWYGDMTLAGHLWRLLGLGRVGAEVTFHPAVDATRFVSRKALAAHCQAAVAAGVAESLGRGSLDSRKCGARVE